MSDRKRWIDIYKGLAIMLVVLGHLRIGQGLYRFIFLFHMYAFFFISGLTCRPGKKPFSTFLLGNLKGLYVPYVIYGGLWVATELAMGVYQGMTPLPTAAELADHAANLLLGGGVIDGTAQVGPAWFLCALLVVRVVYELIGRMSRRNGYVLAAFAAVFLLLAYLLEGYAAAPLRLTAALSAFAFYWAGDRCKGWLDADGNFLCRGWRRLFWLGVSAIGFGLTALMAMNSQQALILGGNILPGPWFVPLVGGLGGCAGLVGVALRLDQWPLAGKIAAFFGGCSMMVMGLHSQMRLGLYLLLPLSGWLLEAAVFVLTLGLSVPLALLMGRYLPVLAGKKKSDGRKQGKN